MMYCAELPYATEATAYFAAITDLPWAAWLDSGGRGRFDILCAEPAVTLQTRGSVTEVSTSAGTCAERGDPFELVRRQLGEVSTGVPDIPFAGGVLGYWGYDLARILSDLPDQAQDAEQIADMAVGIYDWALVIDHQRQRANLVSRQRFAATADRLPQLLARFRAAQPRQIEAFEVNGAITSNFSKERYAQAFARVQHYLHAGDCYQVNLAQRFAARAQGDGLTAYLSLRRLNPAPFAAYLKLPQLQILCASPERFLQVRERQVETKPIKGTRPRMQDATADARQIEDLRNHPKDRAENLMIVDLLRNDLGKNCLEGTVRVPRLFEVESYATVHHLVSTVVGELAPGRDALHLLRDSFPGGSVTGAPKQRAMEIIEELEPNRRGVYCGAIGYVGFDGNMDTNIAIRTLVYGNGEIRCWAGGGLVADSQMEAEYQETMDKARAMLQVLQRHGGRLTTEGGE